MNIEKSAWVNSSHKMTLSFPIAKVNKEKRTVSGFATLDNYDRHGDRVTSDASKAAFERFRGNLREMHQPIAVGKVLSFEEQDFYNPEDGKTYKGVFVQTYISKGAQDTWEKVLDGTLTGFSIGGNIIQASFEKGDNEEDEEVRVIKEYDLHELSLVDSPANPLANIFSIQKSGDNLIFKGMATEIETENVFWCGADEIAVSSSYDTKNCSICGDKMESVGWIEKDDFEKSFSIKKAVDAYLRKDDAPGPSHGPNGSVESSSAPLSVIDSEDTINLYPDQAGNNISTTKANKKKKKNKIKKGGNIVDENIEELSDQAEEIDEVVEDGDDSAVDAADVSEVEIDDADFTKMVTDLKEFVGEKLEKSLADSSVQTSELRKAIATETAEIQKKFDAEKAELTKRIDAEIVERENLVKAIDVLKETVEELKKSLTETSNVLAAVENDTAIKKSGEVEVSESTVQKTNNIWRGSFLGASDL